MPLPIRESGSTDSFFLYLPVGERDVRWGVHVTGAGEATIPAGAVYPPPKLHPEFYDFTWGRGRTLPEYQLIYLSRGAGEFESAATGLRAVSAGAVLLLFPGVWHRYRPAADTGWTEHWVGFSGDHVRGLQTAGFFAPERAVLDAQSAGADPSSDADLSAGFGRLLGRLKADPGDGRPRPGLPQLLAGDVAGLLAAAWAAAAGTLAATEATAAGGDRASADGSGAAATTTNPGGLPAAGPAAVADRLVAAAIRIIWSTGRRAVTVDDIADELAVARRSLERHFHKHLGHGIHDEIVRCRVARAKRLLADPALSADQVATAAGFADARSLRRAFQAAEGRSPQAYRQDAHGPGGGG